MWVGSGKGKRKGHTVRNSERIGRKIDTLKGMVVGGGAGSLVCDRGLARHSCRVGREGGGVHD
jgi:hypothetical protein